MIARKDKTVAKSASAIVVLPSEVVEGTSKVAGALALTKRDCVDDKILTHFALFKQCFSEVHWLLANVHRQNPQGVGIVGFS